MVETVQKFPIPRWLLVLLGVAAAAVIVASLLRLLTPSQPEIPTPPAFQTNFNNTTTTYTGVVFSGPTPALPQSLPVYASQTQDVSQTLIPELVSELGLISAPEFGEYWSNSEYQLYPTPIGYQLTRNGGQLTPQLQIIDPQQAFQAAQVFVSNNFPSFNFTIYEAGTDWLISDEFQIEVETAPQSQANMATIPFTYLLSDFPVYFAQSTTYPLMVQITSNLHINQAIIQPQASVFTPIADYPVLSINDALTAIRAGNAAILSAHNPALVTPDLSQVSLDLTSVSLEYRTGQEGMAIPTYRFFGTGTTPDGQASEMQVITPAVQTTPS